MGNKLVKPKENESFMSSSIELDIIIIELSFFLLLFLYHAEHSTCFNGSIGVPGATVEYVHGQRTSLLQT